MPDHLLHILLIEDNPGDALLVQEMLFDADDGGFTIHRADSLLDGLDKLAQHSIDVILLDLSLPDSQGIDTFTTVHTHARGVPIVLLTGNDNDELALQAVEKGAQDYLVKDKLDASRLIRALRYAVVRHQNAAEQASAEPDASAGTLIGVLGAKGGVGASTVACHLAVALASQTGKPVLLADLDLQGGSLGFLMQSRSPYTILDAAENVHRLDQTAWESLVARHESGVDVLPSPGLLGQTEAPPAGRFEHALRFAQRLYGWLVVDLGRLNGLAARIAPRLDRVLVVTTSELVAVHDAGRTYQRLTALGLGEDRLSLVHNRFERWSAGTSVLKAVVDAPVRLKLPDCESEMAAGYTKGRLLEETTPFGQALGRYAAELAGIEFKSQPSSGFSLRWLALFGAREATATHQSGK